MFRENPFYFLRKPLQLCFSVCLNDEEACIITEIADLAIILHSKIAFVAFVDLSGVLKLNVGFENRMGYDVPCTISPREIFSPSVIYDLLCLFRRSCRESGYPSDVSVLVRDCIQHLRTCSGIREIIYCYDADVSVAETKRNQRGVYIIIPQCIRQS